MARRLAVRHGCEVVVTAGELGLWWADGGRVRRVPAVPVEVRDVCGAGDAVLATLGVVMAGGGGMAGRVRERRWGWRGNGVGYIGMAATVPSPDALRYFDWAVREVLIPDVKSKDGHQITLASGYNKPKTQPRPDQSHLCDTRPIWTPWGWGMDRSRFRLAPGELVHGQPEVLHVQDQGPVPPHAA